MYVSNLTRLHVHEVCKGELLILFNAPQQWMPCKNISWQFDFWFKMLTYMLKYLQLCVVVLPCYNFNDVCMINDYLTYKIYLIPHCTEVENLLITIGITIK